MTITVKETLEPRECEKLLAGLAKAGVVLTPHPYHAAAFTLVGAEGVRSLPGFEEGLFTVQDVSSMLVCEAADIRPGDRVSRRVRISRGESPSCGRKGRR